MEDKVLRKLFLDFINIHILHHVKERFIFGFWMLKELLEHGYTISQGTLYPILHTMEKTNFCKSKIVMSMVKSASATLLLRKEAKF